MQSKSKLASICDRENGLTLIEMLASIVISSMVILSVVTISSAVSALFKQTGQAYEKFSDTANVFTDVERLAQSATSIGYDEGGTFVAYSGTAPNTNTSISMQVTTLSGIPSTSGLAQYFAGKTAPYSIDLNFLPDSADGRTEFTVWPLGTSTPSAANDYQCFSTYTDFAGSTFSISNSSTFMMSLDREVRLVSGIHTTGSLHLPLQTEYQFIIGSFSF